MFECENVTNRISFVDSVVVDFRFILDEGDIEDYSINWTDDSHEIDLEITKHKLFYTRLIAASMNMEDFNKKIGIKIGQEYKEFIELAEAYTGYWNINDEGEFEFLGRVGELAKSEHRI